MDAKPIQPTCSRSLRRMFHVAILAGVALPSSCLTVRADSTDFAAPATDRFRLDVEAQRVDTLVNSIRKGEQYAGSEFDSTPYTGHTSSEVRFSAYYALGAFSPEDELRLVAAPFIASGSAPLPAPLLYDGVEFSPGRPLTLFYKFNTYRITYDAPIWRAHGCVIRLGGTLALRDAQVSLAQPGVSRIYKNLGPVPLLYASIAQRWSDRLSTEAEFDGFPAPGGGGLFDGSARISCRVYSTASLFAGARYQFGGASEPDLYNNLRQIAGILGLAYRF